MSLTVSDITRNADLFRAAYPGWPHAEPEPRPAVASNCGISAVPPSSRRRLIPSVTDEGRCQSCGHLPGCSDDCCAEV